MKKNVINVMLGLFVIVVLGLTGCGGGGGSSSAGGGAGTTDTVSGVAAAGAVVSGTVYLKDSATTPKELSKTIATDGSYSFDVTGMTKPYLLKAVGTANGANYTLYSLATDKGTANINPLSNLIVHNAAGVSDIGTLYSSPQLTTMQTIAGKMPQATTDVKTSIMPLLTTYAVSSVNPITDTYKADHSGLDGMFDKVTVSVASGTATITNTSTGTTIFTSPVTSIMTGTVTSGNIPQPSTYIISGAVTYNGTGLSGVTITLSGAGSKTATTDSSGNYTFSGILNGSYTIAPDKTGYIFGSNLTAVVNGANQTGLNFTATTAVTPTYSISGTITDGSSALAGVIVTLTGSGSTTATTDSSGNYTFSGAQNGSYTITPSLNNFIFIPISRSVSISGGSSINNNFSATAASAMTVSTLAGSAMVAGSADGTGSAARFRNPDGITTDGTNLYLADSGNNSIRKIVIATSEVTTLAGGSSLVSGSTDGIGTSARFQYPSGITTDGTNLYVADSGNYSIRKIVIATGEVTTLAGGSYGSTDGIGTSARFKEPRKITTDGVNIYVFDNGSYLLRKIVIATGAVSTLLTNGSGITQISSMVTNGTNLYIGGSSLIRKFDLATGVETTLTREINFATGLTLDGINIYVTDLNNTIQKVNITTGVVTTLAGSAGVSGSTDGKGTSARFNWPGDITIVGNKFFITDLKNHTIRIMQ